MYALIAVCVSICFGCLSSLPVSDIAIPIADGLTIGNASQEVFQAKIGSEICMKDLGCFKITKDFFHILYRPINVLPKDRVTIDTRFELFTNDAPKSAYMLDVRNLADIKNSKVDPKIPTRFIVHGFMENRVTAKWMYEMKDNLLLREKCNVIIVDWSRGNGVPYTQATANTRVVGAEIALMITTLQKQKDVSPINCHVIGHSLGSHIAGYAGEGTKKLGRITGVDPAEPYFQNLPPVVRLDPSDAEFVDIIHTDSKSMAFLGLGMSQLCGHVDFFPNNGKNQPGCDSQHYRSILTDGLVEATRRFVACNHQRSVDFFTYSINHHDAPPVGYDCPSWQDYLKGNCADCGPKGSKCAVMGFRADEFKPHKNDAKPLKLYLSTSGKEPYWLTHYQVSVKLAKPKGFSDRKGKLIVTLNGKKKSLKTTLTPKAIDLNHGASYPFLVTTEDNLGEITSVTFSWENSFSINIFKTQAIYLEYVKLIPMNVVDDAERKKQVKTFCESSKAAISAKTNKELKVTKC